MGSRERERIHDRGCPGLAARWRAGRGPFWPLGARVAARTLVQVHPVTENDDLTGSNKTSLGPLFWAPFVVLLQPLRKNSIERSRLAARLLHAGNPQILISLGRRVRMGHEFHHAPDGNAVERELVGHMLAGCMLVVNMLVVNMAVVCMAAKHAPFANAPFAYLFVA